MQRYGEPAGDAPAPAPADADRAARWTIRFMAVAVFVVVVAAVLRLSLGSLDRGPSSPAVARGGGARAGPVTVDDLGPQAGVDLAAYSQSRRAALAAGTGDRVAVVSFNAYATEAQARGLAGSLTVVALLVAPPGAGPTPVAGSLSSWANDQAMRLRDERDEIRKLIPTVTDTAFKDFYTAEVDRLDKAATAVKPGTNMVFGVVVRGPAASLQALAARPEFRLVDVGDGSEPAARATYRGLRPEERLKSADPQTRPAP